MNSGRLVRDSAEKTSADEPVIIKIDQNWFITVLKHIILKSGTFSSPDFQISITEKQSGDRP